jgi:hypothetical protein
MTNRLRSFLSRLALPLILLSPPLAVADTVTTFDVSGTAENASSVKLGSCAVRATCAFSGTFQVDVTTGTVETSGVDFSFPGLPALNMLVGQSAFGPNDWRLFADDFQTHDEVFLDFTTAPTPGSLVGFTGGSIVGIGSIVVPGHPGLFYDHLGGTIIPVPEPSSLVPLAGGIGWLVFGLARRRVARLRALR